MLHRRQPLRQDSYLAGLDELHSASAAVLSFAQLRRRHCDLFRDLLPAIPELYQAPRIPHRPRGSFHQALPSPARLELVVTPRLLRQQRLPDWAPDTRLIRRPLLAPTPFPTIPTLRLAPGNASRLPSRTRQILAAVTRLRPLATTLHITRLSSTPRLSPCPKHLARYTLPPLPWVLAQALLQLATRRHRCRLQFPPCPRSSPVSRLVSVPNLDTPGCFRRI